MLSIGKLTGGAGSASYYEQAVASGREDYYSGRGEAAGEWAGAGSDALGLAGEVGPGELGELLGAAVNPAEGLPLRAGSAFAVQGFDLTFSAPKSVSVLYAVGDDSLRAAVVDAHEAAIRDALGYLEREAVQVRRGAGGAVKEHAGGLVAAAFRHRTSRAGDPQLHTHVVAANLAQGSDGRWTALHAAPLYAHGKTAGFLYQAALRDGLTRTLGVGWTAARNGCAEVVGVPRGTLEEFSQRRREIIEAMRVAGTTSARAAEVAALATRRAKDYSVMEHSIYERWQARAGEHGFDRTTVADVLDRPGARPAGDARTGLDVEQASRLMTGKAGLTARASTFGRREAIRAWCEQHQAGAGVAQIEELTDRWLASPLAVRLDAIGAVTSSDVIQTAGGRRIACEEARYSTPDMLATEAALLHAADEGRGVSAGVVSEAALDGALAARPSLRGEQVAMVTQLTRSGDRIDAVRGLAGTGKTFALDAAAQAWRDSDLPVAGVALSGKAADVLTEQTGVPASTIARFFIDQERYPDQGLAPGQVLIVEEAGMVGTRDLARLADLIERADGKLVLIGDDHQLPEMDAGGAFRALVARQGGVELTEVVRQRDPRQIAELRALRDGRAEDALRSMAERGAVTTGVTAEQTRELMVHAWHAGHQRADRDGAAFMVAKRNSDVRDLNHRARQLLIERGELGANEIQIGNRAFREGDRVVIGRNDPGLGVRNGTAGTISRIDLDASELHIASDAGRDLAMPFEFAAKTTPTGRPHIEHAYAVTVHRGQGDTWGSAYYLGGEDSYQQEAYTALSRPTGQARFFTTVPIQIDPEPREHPEPVSDLRTVIHALNRDQRQQLATDVAAISPLGALSREQLQTARSELQQSLGAPPAAAALSLGRIDRDLVLWTQEARRAAEHLADCAQRLKDARRGADRKFARNARDAAQRAANHHAERLKLAHERHAQILRHAGDPRQWTHQHHHGIVRILAADAELAGRDQLDQQIALQNVVVKPPAHITDAIGPPPQDPVRRGIWNQATQTIEHHRRHTPGTPPDAPGLGQRPHGRAARESYRSHREELERLQDRLRDPTRAPHEHSTPTHDLGPDR